MSDVYNRSVPHRRMLEILRSHAAEGVMPGELHAQLVREGHDRLQRQTVHDWLNLEVGRGMVVQPTRRGPYFPVLE